MREPWGAGHLENFVEDCRAAVNEDPSHRTISTVVERAFFEPSNILAALGEPKEIIWYPSKHHDIPIDKVYPDGIRWFDTYLLPSTKN